MNPSARQPLSAGALLGFDHGARRIGVAIGNSVSGTASPLETIEVRSTAQVFARIAALIDEWAPARLVVGRPLTEDGGTQAATLAAERFARRLHGRFGLPVEPVDERYSSLSAQSRLRTAGRGGPDDATAAAILLQQFLDESRSRDPAR